MQGIIAIRSRQFAFVGFLLFWNFITLGQRAQLSPASSLSNNVAREPTISYKDCKAYIKEDSLIIENSMIKRVFLFNHGNLTSCSIWNKQSGGYWLLDGGHPDFSLPGKLDSATDATFKTRATIETPQQASHLEAEVVTSYGDLQVKRVFRIYPFTPAIACDTYLKGYASKWAQRIQELADIKNAASSLRYDQQENVVLDHLSLPGHNWKVKSVEFFDATDENNTLLQEYSRTEYAREQRLRGNLLLMEELPSREELFWLKEAPVSTAQLDYAGFDFSVKFGDFKTVGIGLNPADLSTGV